MLERLTHPASLVRRVATTICTVTLAVGLVSGCGFYTATDRPYTPATGVNDNPPDSQVAVLGAVVVSTEPGSGTFIATISNKSLVDDVALIAVAGADADMPITSDEFEPKVATNGSYINLAEDGGVKVNGDFEAGNFVRLNLTFDSGDRLTMDMPVVPNAGYYAGLDGPAPPEAEQIEETEG